MFLYLTPFLISLVISLIATYFCVRWGGRVSRSRAFEGGKPPERKKPISRLGGIGIITAFLMALLLNQELFISAQLKGVMVAALVILIFGIWDDVKSISWKVQLAFQVAASLIVYGSGVRVGYISNPLGGAIPIEDWHFLAGALFVIVWVVLVTNALNWFDGVDGLSGGATLIGTLAIFFISLRPDVNQPPVGIISMSLAGALVGFLIFNFYPARVFAGTSGSMFMGFMLAVLAIFAGAKLATAILVLTIPIMDALRVIGWRLISDKSVFQSDESHLHYKLMRLGWGHRKITVVFYAASLILAVAALLTEDMAKLAAILVSVAVLSVIFFIIHNRDYATAK